MLPDKNIKCPATGFAKTCHSIVTKCLCPKWVNIKGKDPQSSVEIDQWGCVDTFLPKLLIEISQKTHQLGSGIDRFNADFVRMNGIAQAVLSASPALPPPKAALQIEG
jgi:hypothetical protein